MVREAIGAGVIALQSTLAVALWGDWLVVLPDWPILRAMALPNLWGLYNLRSSPFFQATLRAQYRQSPAGGAVAGEATLGVADLAATD
jgi:hypothetical protein